MKKIFYALFAAAFAMSCSEATVDEGAIQPEVGQGTPIEIFAVGDGESRTTYFEDEGLGVHWEAGDLISVRRFTTSTEDADTRIRSTYKALQSGPSTGFEYQEASGAQWAELSFIEGVENTVTAFYPKTNNGSAAKSDIVLPADQKQAKEGDDSHLGDYMAMMAEPQTFAANALPSAVYLKFKNLYAIVELNLQTAVAGKQVSSVSLTSADGVLATQKTVLNTTLSLAEVKENFPQPTVANALNEVVLTLTEPATLSTEAAKLYLVVYPGQHAAGDITLTVQCTDNTVSTVKMGAINFEMNKVYRPVITLTEFVEPVVYDAAELELSGNDASKLFGSVNFENGAHIVANRTKVNGHGADMFVNNIPEKFYHSAETPWQTLSVMSGLQLDLNVKVKTSGMVYVMVGCHNAASYEVLLEKGWEAETPIKSANATAVQIAGFATGVWDDSFPIFYATSITDVKINDPGYFTIFSRYYEANESFNLKDLMNAQEFRGIRIVAKKFTWPVAQAEIQKTTALSDGELKTFEAGSTLGVNHANSAIVDTNKDGDVKSVPAGYVGMKFFALKRGTTAAPNCRTVTAKITKSGMLYQLVPKNAQSLIMPQADGDTRARDAYNGWRVVEWFYLNSTTAHPFYISAQWVEAGTEVTTYDYTDVVTEAAAELNYFNTGILMGDLTVKEITE